MPISRTILAAAILCCAATFRASAQSASLVAERILAAALVPGLALEARSAGAPDRDIVALLDVFRTKSVAADEARIVLAEQTRAVREHGPVDNFGSFVQARLAEGLRGRELAAAIRAEHAARGKGKAKAKEWEEDTKPAADKERSERGGTKGSQRPVR